MKAYSIILGLLLGSHVLAAPPVAVNDFTNTVEDVRVTIQPLVNDSDPDGNRLTITSVSPTNGTASIAGTNVVFTPATNFSGTATIGYRISDGNGGTAGALITVMVTAVNDPPVAVNDLANTIQDVPVTIHPLANDSDADGDTLTITSVNPTNGTASIAGTNIVFRPATKFTGTATIGYSINDGHGATATALITVTVSEVSDLKRELSDLNECKDRLTLSARFGFNVRAKFGPRLTPDGLAYNYLDGYVLRDSTGDFDPTGTFPGITQNWGYDNSARQRDGSAAVGGFPTVSMTRLASGADPLTDKFDDDPNPGFELVYGRRLYVSDQWHFGVEAAVNFTSIGLRESGTTSGSGFLDAFQYFPGTSPPNSPNANGEPFQGTFGPGTGGPQYALISDTAAGSTAVPDIRVASQRKFDADLWGFRLGPYVEYQLGRRWAVNVVGGLAVAIVQGEASWSQTLTVNNVRDATYSGHGSDSDVMWGWYVGANVTWHIHRRWDVTGGVQYQDVGIYRQNAGARQAELDLSQAIFVSIGVSRRF